MMRRVEMRWQALALSVGLGALGVGCGRPQGGSQVEVTPTASLAVSPHQAVVDDVAPGGEFRFPADQGGALLAALLPPSEVGYAAEADRPSGPRTLPVPPDIEKPALPTTPNAAPPARLPGPVPRPTRAPGGLAEDAPYLGYSADPTLPEVVRLPLTERPRLGGLDVREAAALPVLGQTLPDRTPLDDPTAEASLGLALSATMPARANPVPFAREGLMEPFEHRRPVAGRVEAPEELTPQVASPRLPGR